MHSGQSIGKVFSPFLAGTEEPFTIEGMYVRIAIVCYFLSTCVHNLL